MIPEARLEATEHGLVPTDKGWFVLNARNAPWVDRPGRGAYCEFEGFEGKADFSQLGVNLTVLAPGEPMAMYHFENDQEDFLVPVALRHGAGVEHETTEPAVAYSRFPPSERTRCRDEWLPDPARA